MQLHVHDFIQCGVMAKLCLCADLCLPTVSVRESCKGLRILSYSGQLPDEGVQQYAQYSTKTTL